MYGIWQGAQQGTLLHPGDLICFAQESGDFPECMLPPPLATTNLENSFPPQFNFSFHGSQVLFYMLLILHVTLQVTI